MKVILILSMLLSASISLNASEPDRPEGVVYAWTESYVEDVALVEITGHAAKILYDQFVEWGSSIGDCDNQVSGPGFVCTKRFDINYNCYSTITANKIEGYPIHCEGNNP